MSRELDQEFDRIPQADQQKIKSFFADNPDLGPDFSNTWGLRVAYEKSSDGYVKKIYQGTQSWQID